jgi:tetratricopeptide (TPR) repeat protein
MESSHSAGLGIPALASPGAGLYQARVNAWDARAAEQLLLQQIRTELLRSRFDEAQQSIEQAQSSGIEPAEVYLEKARLAALSRRWEDCVEACTRALASQPAAITQLTLYQVRALAWFELGEMSRALSDLSRIESLAPLFPDAPPAFYARALEARIRARTRSPAHGQAIAAELLRATLGRRALNLDDALTLLRLEIDLRRLQSQAILPLAIATHAIADAIGDRLYAAYALLDAYCAMNRTPPEALQASEWREFEAARVLEQEIFSVLPRTSTTAETIRNSMTGPSEAPQEQLTPLTLIFWKTHSLRFDLRSRTVKKVSVSERSLAIATVIADFPRISKSGLFARTWPGMRYTPRLHDGLIRTSLSRLRKETGLELKIVEGDVILAASARVIA